MTVYLLYYDTNYGNREEWNTFYTPVEGFSTPEKRDERIEELKAAVDRDNEPYNYNFYKSEIEVK